MEAQNLWDAECIEVQQDKEADADRWNRTRQHESYQRPGKSGLFCACSSLAAVAGHYTDACCLPRHSGRLGVQRWALG